MSNLNQRKVLSQLPFPLNELSLLLGGIDIIWFRGLSIATSIGGIGYKIAYPHDTPLFLVVLWNVVFVAINLTHITLVLSERRNVRFSPDERRVYESIFSRLSPVEFNTLLRVARWNDLETGQILTEQGQAVTEMVLLFAGRVGVEVDGRQVAQLGENSFIGEMSLLSHSDASATVRVLEPTRTLSWQRDELCALLKRNPNLEPLLHGLFASDLSKKLLLQHRG